MNRAQRENAGEGSLLPSDEPWLGGWWPRRWRLPDIPELPWPPPLSPRQWRITATATATITVTVAWLAPVGGGVTRSVSGATVLARSLP